MHMANEINAAADDQDGGHGPQNQYWHFSSPPISCSRGRNGKKGQTFRRERNGQVDGEFIAAPHTAARENVMKKLMLISAAALLVSTSAMAQTTVTTTTGAAHGAAVQIEPEYRTKIRSYVTEHKIRPVETREKIVVGSPVPRDVELATVPSDWGPSLTKYRYVYSGSHVMLVDPETRMVVQEVD
jgi:hypothetical protein